MADNRQFGSPKILQFGDKATGGQPGDCAQCEAMLADALDGALSAEDQALFDLHLAHCGPCAQDLADARRGAAFLEMLRTPAPEPPAELLERILAQTSGQTSAASFQPNAAGFNPASLTHPQQVVPAMAAGYLATGVPSANVVPFPRRFVAAVRRNTLGQLMLQPRLAMTAAMAFFSIALTMNLTGIHPTALRVSDLKPSSLKRDFYSANTRVVQYYEGLRVVYELESRVHDLQNSQDADPKAGTQTAPTQPDQTPASQPDPADQKTAPASGGSKHDGDKPAPGPGSSRRETPIQSRRFVAYSHDEPEPGQAVHASAGRKLV